ncbi:hypothetical protein DFH06DRAFT_143390 [Mycena polygramma]|nr:hypothetical protein DFH06DRAFT_143390 [Mycena polygramma]
MWTALRILAVVLTAIHTRISLVLLTTSSRQKVSSAPDRHSSGPSRTGGLCRHIVSYYGNSTQRRCVPDATEPLLPTANHGHPGSDSCLPRVYAQSCFVHPQMPNFPKRQLCLCTMRIT